MRILYFAWLRQRLGKSEEDALPPEEVSDVAGLIDWLADQGGAYAKAFQNRQVIRVAVNQEYVPFDHPVRPGDEVALFPPMTGG